MNKWWSFEIDKIKGILETDANLGLTFAEAEARLKKYGANSLREKKKHAPIVIFFEQFKDFMIFVLLGAALVSGFLKEWIDALAIIAIIILNAILGFIQEYRAEKSLAALKKLSSPNSKVIRDGKLNIIPSHLFVLGDLIELEAGDNVPADCRLTWATTNFGVQEASLTGESTPVLKSTIALEEKEIPLAERANMVYMGTFVVGGKARALIVEAGMQTELGKIAGMIQEIPQEDTPLQKKLEQFGKWIVYLCFVLVAIVFGLGLLRGGKFLEMFLTSVSLAVAAIPEGLPAVVTIALALGVQRMVKRHALIRRLPSVETLGCATVICSDKTGTLTKNEMTVQAVFTIGNLYKVSGIGYEPKGEFFKDKNKIGLKDALDLKNVLESAILCNGAELLETNGQYKIVGDPTEAAILVAGAKLGLWKDNLEEDFAFTEEIPFDSVRKKMSIVRKNKDNLIIFTKGAPDVLLNDCRFIQENGSLRNLNAKDKADVLAANDYLSSQAMRVLAVAYKKI